MIRTTEVLKDPVAYITENVDPSEGISRQGFEIVSGADFDVAISPQTTMRASGRMDFEVSKALGNLYVSGVARGVQAKNVVLDMLWYPSPAAVNTLVESLDLRPGEDTFEFVHSEHDKIPGPAYLAHLAAGEYPQSSGFEQFIHDRSHDHAIGVILMPPSIKEAFSQSLYGKNGEVNHYRKGIDLVREFDTFTSVIGNICEDKAGETERYSGRVFGISALARVYGVRHRSRMQAVVEVQSHFQKLQPKIQALQAAAEQVVR